MAAVSIPNLITSTAQAAGVPPALAMQVAIQESGLNPNAVGSAGEIGIFQLMPSTAQQLGVDAGDPAQNIAGGISYLAQLFQQFGDWGTALAAYNWGEGKVAKYGPGAAPASTKSYVASALSAAGLTPASQAPAGTALATQAGAPAPYDSGLPAPAGDTIDLAPDGTPIASAMPNFILLALAALGVYIVFDFFFERE